MLRQMLTSATCKLDIKASNRKVPTIPRILATISLIHNLLYSCQCFQTSQGELFTQNLASFSHVSIGKNKNKNKKSYDASMIRDSPCKWTPSTELETSKSDLQGTRYKYPPLVRSDNYLAQRQVSQLNIHKLNLIHWNFHVKAPQTSDQTGR